MRLLQVSIPAGKREAVVGVLDDEGIDYVLSEETGRQGYTHIVSFPLPTNAVDPVLDRLQDVGVGEDAYAVVVEARAVPSRQFDALSERYSEEDDGQESISKEELARTAQGHVSDMRTYVILTAVSAIVATAGLLLDSPATVVGSMVIAPLIGPAMSTAVASVIDDEALFSRGVRMQVIGMVLAVAAAAVFAYFVRVMNLIPPGLDPSAVGQIEGRLTPDFLSLAVALGAGVAGALSLTTGVSAALVGVMIAVALVPPAAAVGIGIAYGLPSVAIPSGILAVVNGLSINLAALVVLWYTGYRPDHILRRNEARAATLKRIGILLVSIALLSVFLGGVTFNTYQSAQAEGDIRSVVESTLDSEPYAEAELVSMEIETEPTQFNLVFTQPSSLVVSVGVPPGWEQQNLASTLRSRLDESGRSMPVEVRYVTVERAGEGAAADTTDTTSMIGTTAVERAPIPAEMPQRAV